MSDLPQALAGALAAVQRPGGFHCAGSFDIHPPRLEVEGVGAVALPLLPVQAEALIQVAEQAPYGRGTDTLVDTAVRRTWQLDAARVRLTGQRWAADLAEVVERVRQGLAVAGAIEAQLYKLLIYDAGSFFVTHRDTEKAPGMFATLVVVLPGDYSGGELIIRHRGQEARVDLHRDEPSEAAFAAFYAVLRQLPSQQATTLLTAVIAGNVARLAGACAGLLARFLGSPTEPAWHFKAAEADRSHVAHTVSRANCDLDLTTDKRGRPYTLVCTKNRASFERRVRQRALDLEHRGRLAG